MTSVQETNDVERKVKILKELFLGREDYLTVAGYGGKPDPVQPSDLDGLLRAHVGGPKVPGTWVRLYRKKQASNLLGPDHFRIGTFFHDDNDFVRNACIDIDGPGHTNPVADPLGVAQQLVMEARALGLPGYIEKSGSGHGYHVWFFFKAPIEAAVARRLMFSLVPSDVPLAKGGAARPRAGVGIEVFPKQDSAKGGFGNSMWAPFWWGAPEGANQFYEMSSDNSRRLIPLNVERFDAIDTSLVYSLAGEVQTSIGRKRAQSGSSDAPSSTGHKRSPNVYEPKIPFAGLWHLICGCVAIADLVLTGVTRQLTHHEGFALLSHLATMKDGREWFGVRMAGWDKNSADAEQIDSFASVYAPYSCHKMQELGLCKKERPDACLSAIGGKSPSPQRFAVRAMKAIKIFDDEDTQQDGESHAIF